MDKSVATRSFVDAFRCGSTNVAAQVHENTARHRGDEGRIRRLLVAIEESFLQAHDEKARIVRNILEQPTIEASQLRGFVEHCQGEPHLKVLLDKILVELAKSA